MTDDTSTPAPTTTASPASPLSQRGEGAGGEDLTPARQDELRAAYDANVAAGKPPYERVKIRTLGEVQWILRERDWSVDLPLPANQRPDLRGADRSSADLSGADLSGAHFFRANLSGADLRDANLSETYLGGATLSGADLFFANLSGAYLRGANLSGADLFYATLSGTDLRGARMDAATVLGEATLDPKTRLGYVVWNSVPLQLVAGWPARLGDEQDIATAKNRRARITAYRDAARAYRGLSIALRGQGLLIPASDYRLREQVLERKATFLSGNLLGWVFSWLLNLVAGYGERPVRSFIAYLLVLFGFAGAYFALGAGALGFLGLGSHDAITSPLKALVFSVTSFHGRGFFPGGLALDDPITVLAALEAVIGLFIEITFIATFTQRFFGSR